MEASHLWRRAVTLFSGDLANAITKIEGINLESGEEVVKEMIALLQLIARQADHNVQSVDAIKSFCGEARAMIAAIKQVLSPEKMKARRQP